VRVKRPVNLDIGSMKLPLAAWASITHRISGVIVFVGIAILLSLFDLSLSGEEGFAEVKNLAGSPLLKFVMWGLLSALAYHMVAGVKHLLLDFGIGETREAGPRGARIVIAISAVLVILLGVWLW
jgi:succinate dehydrogenase / fumarate reductase, cytochrome b subunit